MHSAIKVFPQNNNNNPSSPIWAGFVVSLSSVFLEFSHVWPWTQCWGNPTSGSHGARSFAWEGDKINEWPLCMSESDKSHSE